MAPAPGSSLPARQDSLPAHAGGILGCIDAIDGDRLFGWAWDPARPSARLPIEIYVDGDRTARMEAAQLREDLAANGIGDGYHAFEYQDPEGRALAGRSIEVRLTGQEGALPAAGQAASVLAGHALFTRLAQLEAAVTELQDEQRKTGKFYHFALKGLETLQRDVTSHDKVLYRQDERTEAILQETSRFGCFVRKIVWNRRFIVTLSFLGLVAHLFWIFVFFF